VAFFLNDKIFSGSHKIKRLQEKQLIANIAITELIHKTQVHLQAVAPAATTPYSARIQPCIYLAS
jgi:hypothetical protein